MQTATLRRVLNIVGDVADAPTAAEFTYRASNHLERLIDAQAVSYNEWDYVEHRLTGFHDRDGFRPELAYLQELWPQCEWLVRMPAPAERWRVETMSDNVPLKELKRREVYSCVYGPIHIANFLAIALRVTERSRGALLLDRDRASSRTTTALSPSCSRRRSHGCSGACGRASALPRACTSWSRRSATCRESRRRPTVPAT